MSDNIDDDFVHVEIHVECPQLPFRVDKEKDKGDINGEPSDQKNADASESTEKKLDLVFVMDCTGSMGQVHRNSIPN